MKWLLNIIGGILILVGIIWILQGINVLPGSFMTGNLLYTYLGIGLDIVGILMLFLSNRRASA